MAYENVWFEEGEEKVVVVDGCEKIVDVATVDYETGNFMFEYYVDRDAPSHVRFEMVIRGIVIDLWFYNHFEDDPNTMIWTLERFFLNGEIEKKEVFEEITKAVETYGCKGNTNEEKKYFIEKFGDDKNGFARVELGEVINEC